MVGLKTNPLAPLLIQDQAQAQVQVQTLVKINNLLLKTHHLIALVDKILAKVLLLINQDQQIQVTIKDLHLIIHAARQIQAMAKDNLLKINLDNQISLIQEILQDKVEPKYQQDLARIRATQVKITKALTMDLIQMHHKIIPTHRTKQDNNVMVHQTLVIKVIKQDLNPTTTLPLQLIQDKGMHKSQLNQVP